MFQRGPLAPPKMADKVLLNGPDTNDASTPSETSSKNSQNKSKTCQEETVNQTSLNNVDHVKTVVSKSSSLTSESESNLPTGEKSLKCDPFSLEKEETLISQLKKFRRKRIESLSEDNGTKVIKNMKAACIPQPNHEPPMPGVEDKMNPSQPNLKRRNSHTLDALIHKACDQRKKTKSPPNPVTRVTSQNVALQTSYPNATWTNDMSLTKLQKENWSLMKERTLAQDAVWKHKVENERLKEVLEKTRQRVKAVEAKEKKCQNEICGLRQSLALEKQKVTLGLEESKLLREKNLELISRLEDYKKREISVARLTKELVDKLNYFNDLEKKLNKG